MKCRAMRIGGIEQSRDVADIRLPARAVGIVTVEQALDLVRCFYPDRLIEAKAQFGLEEIFAKLTSDPDGGAP
jgi:hypothetical protein